jgi:hypothetical protein
MRWLCRTLPLPAIASGGWDKSLSWRADATRCFAAKRTPPASVASALEKSTHYFHYFVLFLVAANILDVLSLSNIYEYILEVTFILI